jgi:hypothetical protein
VKSTEPGLFTLSVCVVHFSTLEISVFLMMVQLEFKHVQNA